MRLTVGLLALAACSIALPARAGDRPHAFTQGTDSLPDGGLELENWFGVAHSRDGEAVWEWWTGPVIGVSDPLEMGFFAIFAQPQVTGTSGNAGMTLDSLRLQLSWKPFERGRLPVDLRVRGELGIPVAGERITTTWGSVIAGRNVGPVSLLANAGGWVEWAGKHGNGERHGYSQGGFGASIDATHGARIGGEIYGRRALHDQRDHEYIAGPSIAWGRGRIWASGTWGLGLDHLSPDRQVRVVIGAVL